MVLGVNNSFQQKVRINFRTEWRLNHKERQFSFHTHTKLNFPRWNCNKRVHCLLESSIKVTEEEIQTLNFDVILATSPEERLSAATLRAQVFYPYSEFRPVFSQNSMVIENQKIAHNSGIQGLLSERIRSEFFRDSKMAFLGMKVTCFLAICKEEDFLNFLDSNPEQKSFGPRGEETFNPPIYSPGKDKSGVSGDSMVALGTLDIQVGKSLPGEDLQGLYPTGENSDLERGYIFNLCVHPYVRRKGIASELMKKGREFGKLNGLKVMYCHVELGNDSAQKLYHSMGYSTEQEEEDKPEEEEGFPRDKPKRRLLRCNIED